MAETHAETFIARDPDEVWKVASDFHGLQNWFPGIPEIRNEGEGVRVIVMAPGMEITETLLSRDDAARTYTYKVESAVLNAQKYETTVRITPAEGGCTATMDAILEPDSLAAMVGPVYEGAVQGLKDHFA
jgi:carbon monoxide dehydrogenase subunit G